MRLLASLPAFCLLLARTCPLAAQAQELPPPAPVSAAGFSSAGFGPALLPPSSAAPAGTVPAAPVGVAPAAASAKPALGAPLAPPPAASDLREVRFVQGDPNPNLNPKLDDPFRAPPTMSGPAMPPQELEHRPLLKDAALTFTWLSGGNTWKGFGTEDLEGSLTFEIPTAPDLPPVLVRTGAAIHFWQQPQYGQPLWTLGLPDRVYDLWADVGWRPRLADWLHADVGLTPGIYTDFDSDNLGFRLRGRAIGLFCVSPETQIAVGAIAVNRVNVSWLPALGVLYSPSPDVQLNFFFPSPKFAWRCRNDGCREWWLYVAGEYGGGAWAVSRGGVYEDDVGYNDWRVNVGFEWKATRGVSGLFEVGYVFNRQLILGHGSWEVDLDPTVMIRAGLIF